jgi:hypothetical protein
LYESGEGDCRGIVEEEVADVIEEESEPVPSQTDVARSVGAVFVSLSCQCYQL